MIKELKPVPSSIRCLTLIIMFLRTVDRTVLPLPSRISRSRVGAATFCSGTTACYAPHCLYIHVFMCNLVYARPYGIARIVTSTALAGKYHLYVSAMDGGVGLCGWGSISRIDHAVADDPMAAFQFVDTPLPKEAHNASPLRAPNGSYLIFHIGNSKGSSFGHHADAPGGPWFPLPHPPAACNNPAPMFVRGSSAAYVGCNDGGFKIYRTEDVFEGNWSYINTMDFPVSWGGHGAESQYLKNEE